MFAYANICNAILDATMSVLLYFNVALWLFSLWTCFYLYNVYNINIISGQMKYYRLLLMA